MMKIGKNGPEYIRKRRELCKTINKEYTKGTSNLLYSTHSLTYSYFRKTLFPMEQGKQHYWIHSIQQAGEVFQNESTQLSFDRLAVIRSERWPNCLTNMSQNRPATARLINWVVGIPRKWRIYQFIGITNPTWLQVPTTTNILNFRPKWLNQPLLKL